MALKCLSLHKIGCTSEVKSLKTLFSAFVLLSVCTTLNKIGCTSEVKS